MSLYKTGGFFTQGPFAESEKRAEDFAANITMSMYFEETVKQQMIIEEEYIQAVCDGNEKLAAEKRQELDLTEGAFKLTATLFDTAANVS